MYVRGNKSLFAKVALLKMLINLLRNMCADFHETSYVGFGTTADHRSFDDLDLSDSKVKFLKSKNNIHVLFRNYCSLLGTIAA